MARDYLLIRKESLECPVCFHFAVDSFCVFPCGHSVCRSCSAMIASQLKSTWTINQFYECPICRQRVSPRESLRPPRNFAIQKLLDSAVSYRKTEFLTRRKKLSCEKVEKKEEEQLAGRIKGNQDRIVQLEIENAKMLALKKRLRCTVWFGFILAVIFLVITVYYARQIRDEPRTCWSLVDWTGQLWPDPRSTWQRIWDYVLLRRTDHPVDKPIINVLRFVDFLICGYIVYRYFRR